MCTESWGGGGGTAMPQCSPLLAAMAAVSSHLRQPPCIPYQVVSDSKPLKPLKHTLHGRDFTTELTKDQKL